jgi:uncharacterized protein YbaR (Trm112 family)
LQNGEGFFSRTSHGTPMDDAFLPLLRCPIDPSRQATLTRDQQTLICSGCKVTFPIKNGLPILVAEEAELPTHIPSPDRLPCVRAATKARNRRE